MGRQPEGGNVAQKKVLAGGPDMFSSEARRTASTGKERELQSGAETLDIKIINDPHIVN